MYSMLYLKELLNVYLAIKYAFADCHDPDIDILYGSRS